MTRSADDRLRDPPGPVDDPDPVRDHGGQFRHHAGRAGRAGPADDRQAEGRKCQRHRAGQRRHRRAQPRRRQRGQRPLPRRARPRPRAHQRARKAIRLRQAALDPFLADDTQLSDLQFRHQLLPGPQRHRPDQGKTAGLDLDRAVDDADHLSGLDPARHQKGGARRQPVRRLDQRGDHRRLCGAELSVRGAADRAVRRRQLSVDLPVARARQRQLGLARLADADRRLFLAHRAADHRAGDSAASRR